MAAELTLSNSEQRLRDLLEAAPIAFISIDSENLILDWNAGAERMFGWSRSEALGRDFSETVSPGSKDGRPAPANLVANLQCRSSDHIEERLLRRDGREFPADITGSRLRAGDSYQLNLFVRDLSHEKTVQEGFRDAERQLAHQAIRDPLTGLPNRALLLDRLHHALCPSNASVSSTALLYLGIDRFRLINDGLGYRVGDELIIEVARRIEDGLCGAARCGESDHTVARLGGDEFAVLCRGLSDKQGAAEVAQRIQLALEDPFTIAGEQLSVSASIGIAFATHSSDADSLIAAAGTAMHSAKDRGHSRCEVFSTSAHARVLHRVRTESQLRDAISKDQLRVFYQPIVSVMNGAVTGFEALLRWNHPEHGLVAPGEFVPIAEDSGLIIPIGRWVMEQACAQLAEWDRCENAPGRLSMAVNVSGRQVLDDDLVGVTNEILDQVALDASQLILEITESSLLDDFGDSLDVFHKLRSLRVRLALDDFGTGYSALGYLRRLPFDVLKLDRSFTANLERTPADSQIAGAVIEMARAISMTVIGEGVETAAQLACLRRLGCHLAQGFYFGRPMPSADVTALLAGMRPSTTNQLSPCRQSTALQGEEDGPHELEQSRAVGRRNGR